jgi:hypothetical protein
MAELEQIRQGLAANLRAIADCQVSAYLLDNPTPPTLEVVGPDEATATTFGRASETLGMIVHGIAGLVSDIGAQKRLDRWWATSGAESVVAAIEADRQLTSRLLEGGRVETGQTAAADTLVVLRKGGYQIFNLPGGRYVGAEWTVQVETTG